ncbi:hypothetical protein [Antarctobacter sp.]|uniref:hypothetical protein n=1 Tax=Antarctobacter sp. TaxID=1872577 RepID=UPI003A954AFD
MTDLDKSYVLEAFDQFAVSERKVKATLGISKRDINKGITNGTFPLPVELPPEIRTLT